jgi:hypothetical protein
MMILQLRIFSERFAGVLWGVCLCVPIMCAPSAAQSAQPASTAWSAPNTQALRAHAEFLASDLLEGRATGSRGYELAAAYVASQFRQYGLSSLLEGGGYLQSASLVEATVVLPGSVMSVKRDNITTMFEFNKDYLPGANFFNANVSLTAPLAFVGYGVNAPEYQYNDFANVDLQGRIAVVLDGAPERFASAAQAYYGWRDTKYAQLVKQGAQGIIEIEPMQRVSNGLPNGWEQAVNAAWITEARAVTAADQPGELFPELKLRFRMNSDAAAQLFASGQSNGQSFEQVMQTAQAGMPQGFNLPGAMTLTATTGLRRIESSNVVGMVRGSDARLRNEYVLVVANLDHLGRGPGVNGDNLYNGMQRNAVGVAMMLEMARLIAAMPDKPRRSIVFAAVTAGEKQGQGLQYLLSSRSLAANKIVAAIVLDTPLPLARTVDVLARGAQQSSLGVTLVAALNEAGLSLSPSNARDLIKESELPLLRANIPLLSLQSGNRARDARISMRALKNEWLLQQRDQPGDDAVNAKMDARAASDLVAVSAATARRIADSDSRPVWYRTGLMNQRLRR